MALLGIVASAFYFQSLCSAGEDKGGIGRHSYRKCPSAPCARKLACCELYHQHALPTLRPNLPGSYPTSIQFRSHSQSQVNQRLVVDVGQFTPNVGPFSQLFGVNLSLKERNTIFLFLCVCLRQMSPDRQYESEQSACFLSDTLKAKMTYAQHIISMIIFYYT